MTSIRHTARINTIDGIMSSDKWSILSSVMKREGELINMARAWDKGKFPVSPRQECHVD